MKRSVGKAGPWTAFATRMLQTVTKRSVHAAPGRSARFPFAERASRIEESMLTCPLASRVAAPFEHFTRYKWP